MDTSKIIIGTVGGGRYTVTAPIVKEDYGLYLKIEGLELPATYEVDFSNSEHNGTAVTMIGNSDGVLIPHQFIDSGKDIFAFLYHVGEDYGRTIFKFRIPNKLRPDRTDDVPTPEEQSVIDQAISALNDAVAQTAQDKADADVSAQSASADAERAEQAKEDASAFAQRSANSAQASADYSSSAQTSATASANSASQSAQIKSDVESMVDDAQGYADSARQSASQASASEQGCARAVLDAASAAAIARARAEEASGYAQTASAKASEASASASTASAKATESAQSASLALGYKNDAEQAKTDAETAQASAEQARDDAQTAQELAESAENNAESTVHGVLDSLDLETTSGSIVETHDAFPASPEKMVVDINPIQDLHGQDTPYPAGGGKNKLPYPYYSQDGTLSGVTFSTAQDGKITASGTTTEGVNFFLARDISLAAGTYTLSIDGTHTALTLLARNPDAGITLASIAPSQATATFTLAETANVRLYFNTSMVGASVSISAYVQLELGTTATAYAPYENICPISGWAGVEIQHTGKNLFDIRQFAKEHPDKCVYDDTTGELTVTSYGALYNQGVTVDIPLDVSGGGYLQCEVKNETGTNFRLRIGYADGTFGGTIGTGTQTGYVVITSNLLAKRVTSIRIDWSTAGTFTVKNFCITQGTTATPYKPYQGRSITIDLGQTVYGGKLDVLSGVLTVDRISETKKWGDLGTVTDLGTNERRKFSLANVPKFTLQSASDDLKCNMVDVYSTTYSLDEIHMYIANNEYAWIYLPDTTDSNADIQLSYSVATPITIQLTPQQITLFKDYNVLWADTGDISEFAYRVGEFVTKADIPEVSVEDVQVNGTSVVQNKVANIDLSGIEQNAEDIASLEDGILKAFPTDTASGAVASFTDGADGLPLKSLVVDIDLVQDLHGYDSPWVGGGGLNKVPLFKSKTVNGVTLTNNNGEITLNGTATADAYFDVDVNILVPNGSTFYLCCFNPVATDSRVSLFAITDNGNPQKNMNVVNGMTTTTATADTTISKFRLRAPIDVTLTDFKCSPMLQIGGTAPTVFSPYENICPISGWTQVDVEQSGKNLLDVDDFTLIKSSSRTKGIILPSKFGIGTYTLSVTVTANTATKTTQISVRDINAQSYVSVGSLAIPSGTTGTLTTEFTATVPFGYIYAFISNSDDDTATVTITDIQLELGSTATPYEPYTGRSITIDLGQTVYGGKLDVLSGVLTLENKKFVSDGSDNWGVYSSFNGYYVALPDMRNGVRQDGISNMLTNSKSSAQGQENAYWLGVNNNNVYLIGVYDSMGATLNEFKAYLAEHNLEIMYPLATPITIQLTPHEVNSLLGQNNIFADTGDTACEYRADPDLYIQRKMPEVPVDDVQIDGSSIVVDGVANVPIASSSALGAIKVNGRGLGIYGNGDAYVSKSNFSQIKNGVQEYSPIVPSNQHQSVFFGLAKAASDTTQSQSSNAVGVYTDEAKVAIQKMLGLNQQGELIADITVTEDVTELIVQTDVNGLPFELSKLIVLFTAGQSTTGTRDSFYTQVAFKNRSGNNATTSCPSITYPSATSNLISRITVDAYKDMPIIETEAVASNNGSTAAMNTMIKTDIADVLTGFRIYQSGSSKSLIPSGSNIKLYGIRA